MDIKEQEITEPSADYTRNFNRGYDLQRLSPPLLKVINEIDLAPEIKEAINAGAKEYREGEMDMTRSTVSPDIWKEIKKSIDDPGIDTDKDKDHDKDRG